MEDDKVVVITKVDPKFWYSLLAVFISCVMIGAASFWYSNYVAQQNVRNFCEVIGTLDQTYQQNPPTTTTGKEIALEMHSLHMKLGCKK